VRIINRILIKIYKIKEYKKFFKNYYLFEVLKVNKLNLNVYIPKILIERKLIKKKNYIFLKVKKCNLI